MQEDSSTVVIEDGVRFSKSGIWAAQRSYYHQQGVEAWSEEVPFYVTSNPVIADKYARIVARFMQDWVSQYSGAATETFYIVELGAGTGQFSFYFLNRIVTLLERLSLTQVKFCYVMTDFTSNNIEFWRTHPAIIPYLEQGVVDFAIFDFEHDQALHLLNQDLTLDAGAVTTPMTVIANYVFDSIVVDVFRAKQGKLTECLVRAEVGAEHMNADKPRWDKAKLSYRDQPIGSDHYQHPVIDAVLAEYQLALNDTYLLFPIGGLQGLENLAAISKGKLLLLSSDKGYVSMPELEDSDPPDIAFHGSFSLMVNYHAIAQYCKKLQGDAFTQDPFDAFATTAFSIGFQFHDLPTTLYALQDNIGSFCPGHYFHFYDHFDKTVNKANLEYIASVLNYTHWDPAIFYLANERISAIVDGADADVVEYISRHLPIVADNFYYVPGMEDSLFVIAAYYQELGEYTLAIEYYNRSRQFFEDGYEIFLNLGDCYLELKQYQKALETFTEALEYQPKSKEIRKLIKQTRRLL